ncbi:MAG TPA: SGNH/GDSL hydrolase family protein [Syntrophomonadaceae bacterium]|nr:SGNH/GDSL hydrolase family protein [Syntrophomonadaceae bacterium]
MKQGSKVVCLGDSITWGFPFGPSYSWVHMLAEATGIEFINRGINGNTTSDMLHRFERDVLNSGPDLVIISGCINDILCGESFDRITWNIKAMVEKAREASLTVVLGMPTAVDSPYLEKLLVRLRQWFKDFSRELGIPLIDFYQAFFSPEGELRQDLLLADGAHPSEKGYQEMFRQIDLNIFSALISP